MDSAIQVLIEKGPELGTALAKMYLNFYKELLKGGYHEPSAAARMGQLADTVNDVLKKELQNGSHPQARP